MATAWRKGARSNDPPGIRKALLLANARWRKEIVDADDVIDRKMLELFLIVELKNRIAAGDIWIRGSRAYRALDEYMVSHQTFAVIKAEALDQKLREAARRLKTSRGDTRIGAKGMRVLAVRTTETEAAIAFARRVATSMPSIG